MRPGEKLFEELYLGDENLVRTVHQKILVLKGDRVERNWIAGQVDFLRSHSETGAAGLRALLCRILPDYVPSGGGVTAPAAPGGSSARESLLALDRVLSSDGRDARALGIASNTWDVA